MTNKNEIFRKICDDKLAQTQCHKENDENGASAYHSFPTAHVHLNKKQLLMVGQPYKIFVLIELPETPRNHESGEFYRNIFKIITKIEILTRNVHGVLRAERLVK